MSSKAEDTNSPNFVIGRNSSSNFCATAAATTCQKTPNVSRMHMEVQLSHISYQKSTSEKA